MVQTKTKEELMKEVLAELIKGKDLSQEEAKGVFSSILEGRPTPSQIASLLTALRLKGETVEEITGAALALRKKVLKVNSRHTAVSIDRDEINVDEETIVDTCGTGGDGTLTFNVSTATAFVVAGAGLKVAKHGNRAVSSLCGSADVVEELGINLDLTVSDAEICLKELGIVFLYAPLFNGAMRHVASIRRELGFRTIFNILGPLTNPAGAQVQVLGVYHPSLTHKLAEVLKRLGTRDAFVVYGEGTLDEISICGPTRVSRLRKGEIEDLELTPEDLGFRRVPVSEIRGGDAQQNAKIIREILDGEKGAKRDMVLMNAAAAFVSAGLDGDLLTGIERAKHSIDSGSAKEKLEALIKLSQSFKPFVRKEL
jgi:anthranilate phosphoribosyltransferase